MSEETKIQTPDEDIFWGRCAPAAVAAAPFKFNAPRWIPARPGEVGEICSHCGGVRPSIALKAIREGGEVIPTDKNYKFYVKIPNANPQELQIIATANFDAGEGYIKADAETLKRYGRDGEGKNTWIKVGPIGPTTEQKCYFNHFSESQAVEFILLRETGKMKLGHPGCFYSGICFGIYKEAIDAAVAKLKEAKPPESGTPSA